MTKAETERLFDKVDMLFKLVFSLSRRGKLSGDGVEELPDWIVGWHLSIFDQLAEQERRPRRCRRGRGYCRW